MKATATLALIAAVLCMEACNVNAARLDVCHKKGAGKNKGEFKKMSIDESALDAHVGHGDGVPGGDVPGMDGYEFDEDCIPKEKVCDCPCWAADDACLSGGCGTPLTPCGEQDGKAQIRWPGPLQSCSGEMCNTESSEPGQLGCSWTRGYTSWDWVEPITVEQEACCRSMILAACTGRRQLSSLRGAVGSV